MKLLAKKTTKMKDPNCQVLIGKVVLFKARVPGCKEIVNLAEESEWVPNQKIPDMYETQVKIDDVSGAGKATYDVVNAYADMHGYKHYDVDRVIDSINVSKYLEGGYIGNHTDEGILEDTGESTLILYLNDDYLHGDFVLAESGIKVKPEAGDILIMPCHYEHYTEPNKEGVKYISLRKITYR